ncbi:hypothetical protein ACGFZA_07750 [Streptomyces sp. NPDC048211]|uniref:hypothetical protein n=1 Tax=Streptomyces sp. NPDC048211 TaxID=3365516 RepID=UPI00371E5960
MNEKAWAWRITSEAPARTRLAAGFTEADRSVPEWDVALSIVEAARTANPILGASRVNVYVWTKSSGLPDGWPEPWASDRDPHGDDRTPSDAAVFSYAPQIDKAPDHEQAGILAAALQRYDEASGRAAIEAAMKVAARTCRDDC